MQISRCKYLRAKSGSIKFQAAFRGHQTRRLLAAVKVQTFKRMHTRRSNFLKIKSAILALQCRMRVKIAKKSLKGLMGEQKDIGKLKQNNEKLKMEMQSLRAMLAAQAKEDASNSRHTKELEEKQAEIGRLEKQIAEMESRLSVEKATVQKLEAELQAQKERSAQELANAQMRVAAQSSAAPASPKHKGKSPHHEPRVSDAELQSMSMPSLPSNYVSPEVVAKHRASVSRLEEELKQERKLRRNADGEIIKLRAAINGVQLNDSEVEALLAQKLQESTPKAMERYVPFGLRSIVRLTPVTVRLIFDLLARLIMF